MFNFTDKRAETRYPVCQKIKYTADLPVGEISNGLAVNISKSGLCLHIYGALNKGQRITFKDSLPNSFKNAVVLWVNKVDDDLYMTGLSCS